MSRLACSLRLLRWIGGALATLCLAAAPAWPQSFLATAFDGDGKFQPISLDVSADGALIVTGIDSGSSPQFAAVRVARFDAAGRKLWERNPAQRSEFVSTVIARAAPHGWTAVLHDETPSDSPQMVMLMLDQNGQTLWRRVIGPGAPSDLLVLADNSLLAAGAANRARGSTFEAVVIRVGLDSKPLWRRGLTTGADSGGSTAEVLRVVGDGFLVAGMSDIAYSGDQATASKGWLFRLDGQGKLLWQQSLAGAAPLTMLSAAVTTQAGDSFAIMLTETASGNQQLDLTKIDPNGKVLWTRPLAGVPGQEITDMAALADGRLVLVGSEPNGDKRSAIFVEVDSEGIERQRISYRGYKLARAVSVRIHPLGGFAILFEGPAGSGFDFTAYVALTDATGRF